MKNHCTDPALIAAVLEHLGELSAIPGLEVRAGKPVYVGQTVFKELSLTPAQKGLVQQGIEHMLAEKCTVGILTQLVFPENLVLKQMFLDLVAYKMVN